MSDHRCCNCIAFRIIKMISMIKSTYYNHHCARVQLLNHHPQTTTTMSTYQRRSLSKCTISTCRYGQRAPTWRALQVQPRQPAKGGKLGSGKPNTRTRARDALNLPTLWRGNGCWCPGGNRSVSLFLPFLLPKTASLARWREKSFCRDLVQPGVCEALFMGLMVLIQQLDSAWGFIMEEDDSNDGENSCGIWGRGLHVWYTRCVWCVLCLAPLSARRARRSRGSSAADKRKSQLQKIRWVQNTSTRVS